MIRPEVYFNIQLPSNRSNWNRTYEISRGCGLADRNVSPRGIVPYTACLGKIGA